MIRRDISNIKWLTESHENRTARLKSNDEIGDFLKKLSVAPSEIEAKLIEKKTSPSSYVEYSKHTHNL